MGSGELMAAGQGWDREERTVFQREAEPRAD